MGAAERAFELMCRRANSRVTRGEPLAGKQIVQDWVATSRIEIDTARLAVLHAAWKIDTVGKKAARQEIAQIKVQVADMINDVVDRAIQVHGALGLSDDTPLAMLARSARALRFGDGPDEVHKVSIARRELGAVPGDERHAGPRRDARGARRGGEPDPGELDATADARRCVARARWALGEACVLRRDPVGEAPQTSRKPSSRSSAPRTRRASPCRARSCARSRRALRDGGDGHGATSRARRSRGACCARDLRAEELGEPSGAPRTARRGPPRTRRARRSVRGRDRCRARRAERDRRRLPALELGLRWLVRGSRRRRPLASSTGTAPG